MAIPKAAIAIAIIGLVIRHYYHLLGFSVVLDYNDQNCSVIGGDILHGSEDITCYSDGLFFVSSGDLGRAMAGDDPHPGAIAIVDLRNTDKPVVSKLNIEGIPTEWRFQPHGIYFSNSTRRLYAISHGLAAHGGTRVFIFSLNESKKNQLPSLQFETTLVSSGDHFFSGAINDIIEGSADGSDIYTSVWISKPFPAAGKHHPANFQERLDLIIAKATTIFYPATYLLRCTLPKKLASKTTTQVDCSIVATGFYGANGITISPERDTIFLADPPSKKVFIYNRNLATGALKQDAILETPYLVDNLEYDVSTRKVYAGVIPIAWIALRKMDGHDVIVPGSLQVFEQKNGRYVVSDVVIHDGTKLTQISSGLQYKNVAIIGSPFSKGVLYCKDV